MVSPENKTPLRSPIRNRDAIHKPFNLWVADRCSHEMYSGDVDSWVGKKSKNILRYIESKFPNEELTPGQRWMLPKLAALVSLGVREGILSAGSGVFVVRGEPPFDNGAEIIEMGGALRLHVTANQLIEFVDMRNITNPSK